MANRKKASGSTWTGEETRLLISLWGREDTQRKLGTVHKNKDIFEQISRGMIERGFEKNSDQCHTKVKNLKTRYRKVLDHNRRSGHNRTTMPFFEELDAILRDHPTSRPVHVLDSTEDSEESADSSSDDDDNTTLDSSGISGVGNEDLETDAPRSPRSPTPPPEENSQDQQTEEEQSSRASSSTPQSSSSQSNDSTPQSKDPPPPAPKRRKNPKEKTRHKKSKMEQALESFAKALPFSSAKEEMKLQIKLQEEQHRHELALFRELIGAFAKSQGSTGQFQGPRPSQDHRYAGQQQGAWGGAGPSQEPQHYSRAWGGAGPSQEQQRYSGAWGADGPSQEQQHYSGVWGGDGPSQEQQRYSGAWGGDGPSQEQQRYSGTLAQQQEASGSTDPSSQGQLEEQGGQLYFNM